LLFVRHAGGGKVPGKMGNTFGFFSRKKGADEGSILTGLSHCNKIIIPLKRQERQKAAVTEWPRKVWLYNGGFLTKKGVKEQQKSVVIHGTLLCLHG
jgi:hypothetical protein